MNWRAAVAELVGTFAFFFTGAGAVIVARLYENVFIERRREPAQRSPAV